MKLITSLLLLIAVSAFGAVPTTRSFRAAGGLIVTSNDVTGIITYDGSGISSPTGGVSASSVSNIVLNNGTRIAPGANVTVATNLTASNTIYTVTSTSPGSGSTNLGVGQSIFLDASFGNDATAQRTNLARPFLTASNATAALLSGDTLFVRGGDYPVHPLADSYDASMLVSNKTNICIRGEPDSIFQLSSLRGDEFGTWGCILKLSRCTNVLIDGITFRGLRTNGLVEQHYAVMLDRCDNVTFNNVRVLNWQNQGVTDLSETTQASNIQFLNSEFSDIGGTNQAALGNDGAAISVSANNIVVENCRFNRNLRDFEFCCSGDNRGFRFENNESVGCYLQHLVFEATNILNVKILNNTVRGYSTTLPSGVNEANWMVVRGMSNAVIQGNDVSGMGGVVWVANQGLNLWDVQILDNTFQDIVHGAGIYAIRIVGQNTFNNRMTIKRNTFINNFQNAIRYGGADGIIEDNHFIDCNGIVGVNGVVSVGSVFSSENTNVTKCRIIGNEFEATAFVALTTGIVVYASSSTNSIWGNEISRNIQGAILDLGVGTLTMPVNVLASGAMLYSDTNSRLARVTMGSGVAFNPTTGTLTGTGGSGGSAITSINEFTNSEVVFALTTNAHSATVQFPFMEAYAGGVDFKFPWAGPATSGPLSSNDWQRFNLGGSGASTNYAFDGTQFELINGTNVAIKSGALVTNLFVHESLVVTNASGLHALSASGTVVAVLTNTANPGTFRVGRYGGKAMQYDGSGNTLKIFGTSAQTTFQLDGASGDQTNAGTLGVAGAALFASTVSIPVGAVSNYVWTCTNATTGMGEWRVSTGGSGTPGGSTFSVQWNTNGTFAGDSFLQYIPAVAAGGDGIGRLIIHDGATYTNMIRALGFGTVSSNDLSLFAHNIQRLVLKPEGHFGPAGFLSNSNAFSLGFYNFPWSTGYVNQLEAKVGITVGTGAGLVGFGTNFTMVGAVSSNSSYEITPTNAAPGIRVALPVVAGVSNQAVNIGLANGQYLTYNGTAYVPSNLPPSSASASTMTQTNFVLNQLYTNTTTTLVSAQVFLTGEAVNGVSSLDLMWYPSGGSGLATLSRVALSTVITGFAIQSTNSIVGVLTNLGSFYFTNSSSGAGNSAGLVAGSGQLTLLSGATGPAGAAGTNASTVPSRTGTVIAFDTPSVYNSISVPGTGNITFDMPGAVTNTEVVLFHHDTTPTFPTNAIIIGNYSSGNPNYIRLLFRSTNEVDVVIVNTNTSGYVNPELNSIMTADVSTTATNATDSGLTVTLQSNSTYTVYISVAMGCNNTGGILFGFVTPTTSTNAMFGFGQLGSTTAFNRTRHVGDGLTTNPLCTFSTTTAFAIFQGVIRTHPTTSGTFKLVFGSAVATQTTTVYKDASYMKLVKVL